LTIFEARPRVIGFFSGGGGSRFSSFAGAVVGAATSGSTLFSVLSSILGGADCSGESSVNPPDDGEFRSRLNAVLRSHFGRVQPDDWHDTPSAVQAPHDLHAVPKRTNCAMLPDGRVQACEKSAGLLIEEIGAVLSLPRRPRTKPAALPCVFRIVRVQLFNAGIESAGRVDDRLDRLRVLPSLIRDKNVYCDQLFGDVGAVSNFPAADRIARSRHE
jgi:hypothetical protein